jgi:outer membrane protein TolC
MFRFKTKRALSRLMYIYSGLLVASNVLPVHASEESKGTLQTIKLVQAQSVQTQSEQGGLLSLSDVLTRARANDFRLKSLGIQAKAFEAEAKASDFLPDPTLFAAIQSLPTDTFEFDQEPMTQLRVGVRQMFPKGDTLSLREDINQKKVGLQTVKQEAYWLGRKQSIEKAWLEAWFWQQNIELISEDRVFLEQIHEFIQSLYEVGSKDQSDLIGAELELIKLEERLIKARRSFQKNLDSLNTLANETLTSTQLPKKLESFDTSTLTLAKSNDLVSSLQNHPKIRLINQKINIAKSKVNLTEQSLEPSYGVELSYGLRSGDNMDGSSRADFFSAGVSVQYPFFNRGQQSSQISAAKHRQAAIELERAEALEQARFTLKDLANQYDITRDQRVLYEEKILPTLDKQKHSAMHSYESDKGNFRIVSELFLKEQSAKVQRLRLLVNEQIILSRINYWLN